MVRCRRQRPPEAALAEKLARARQTRLARECAKLRPEDEKALAEEGLAADSRVWPRLYTALVSAPDRYAYLLDLAPRLAPIFSDTGFAFFDFSDLAVVGASDAEAFDTIHISEKAYVRLFIEMARHDARLSEVVADVGSLSARLTALRSDAYVFDD